MGDSKSFSSRFEDPEARRKRILRQNDNFHKLVYTEEGRQEFRREMYSTVKFVTESSPRLWELQDKRDADPSYIFKQCRSVACTAARKPVSVMDNIVQNVAEKAFRDREIIFPFVTFTEMYPLLLNEDDYPCGVELRHPDRLMRPVFIEGCSASFSLDSSYKPCFLHDFTMYDVSRVLCVRRLLQVIMHFLIRGHLVKLFLPIYYENPYFNNMKQAPLVDDIPTYETLKDLGLIQYITFEESNSGYVDKCKKLVDEMKACFVFRPDVDDQYTRRFASAFLDRDTSQEETTIDPSMMPCSKRVVTANFMTVLDTLVFHDRFSTSIQDGVETDGNNKIQHIRINEKIILEYTEEVYELPAMEVRRQHQLSFPAQVHLLLSLVQLTCFAPDIIRPVQVIVGLAAKGEVMDNEIKEFIKKYLN